MKVLPKSINFSETEPASVEELKDGEMIMTSDGLYARVGDQILLKALPNWAHAIAGIYVYDTEDQGHVIHTLDGSNWTGSGHLFSQGVVIRVVYCGNGIFLGFTGWSETLCLKSTDFGVTWANAATLDTITEPYAADYLENGIVLVGDGGNNGSYIHRSTNYGDNWTNLGSQFALGKITAIGYAGNGVAIAWTTEGVPDKYLRSIDYGATWEDMGSVPGFNGCYQITHLGDGILLANGSGILKSYDRGLTWSFTGGPTGADSLVYLGEGIAIVGTGDDHIWRSTDYGDTWLDRGIPTGPGGTLDQISTVTHLGQGIVVCGSYNDGNLGLSIDYGLNWTTIVEPVALTDWTEWMETSFPKALDAVYDPNMILAYTTGKASDGAVTRTESGVGLWDSIHDAGAGQAVQDTNLQYASPLAMHDAGFDDWFIYRSFLDFDYNVPAGKVIVAAELRVMGWNANDSGVSVQQGTHSNPIVVDDYDAFVGSAFGFVTSWLLDEYNTITLDAAGIVYLNSVSTAKLCLREYQHDYLDVAPASANYYNGMYFYESGFGKPYLKLTLGDAPTTTTTTTTTTT